MVDSEIALGFARAADAPELALMSRDLIEAGLGWAYRADRMAQYIGDPDAVVPGRAGPPYARGPSP